MVFCVASYRILLPCTDVTDAVVDVVRYFNADERTVQAPLGRVVVHLALPPVLKPTLTAAPPTAAPVLRLRTDTVTSARQSRRPHTERPVMLETATDATSGAGGGVVPPPESVPPVASKPLINRFGEPVPALPTLLLDAVDTNFWATAAGVAVGCCCNTWAATPATCGLAIDVPLMVLTAVSPVYQAELMELPGANTSRQEPKLE